MTYEIKNADMRRLWLKATLLDGTPTGPIDVAETIKKLGFVQIDTIQNVTRAHHHILWSRNQNYREPMIDQLLAAQETVFEHFTHDASIIPLEYYPMWTRQFTRLKSWLDKQKRYQAIMKEADLPNIMKRIEAEGPLSTNDFDTKKKDKNKMWARPPHKIALDYMWYAGELATSHRENFRKFYDLSHRVIPNHLKEQVKSDQEQLNWLCGEALEKMGFGNLMDIKNFWDAADRKEVDQWYSANKKKLVPIKWQTADGQWLDAIAPEDIEHRISGLKPPTSRLRIINPFDPAVRDRVRLKNLFGFEYKNEIFVPANKRIWGYYVYPLLEGTRFVGRIELKADRKKGKMHVINFWQEPGIAWHPARKEKLDKELTRLCSLVGLDEIAWP